VKNRLAARLSRALLDGDERARARAFALGWVDGTLHPGYRGACRLAGAFANNEMRRALRARVHHPRPEIARRALEALTFVRHPQLTRAEIERAREIALMQAGKREWLGSRARRIAMWLWTPEWEADLRELVKHHDPQRAAAKRVLGHIDAKRARQARRAGP